MPVSYVTIYDVERIALNLFSSLATPMVRARSQLYGADSVLLIPAPRCSVPWTPASLGTGTAFILRCGVARYEGAPLNTQSLLLQKFKYRQQHSTFIQQGTHVAKVCLQRADYALPANSNNTLAVKRVLLTAYEDFLLAIPNYPAHEVIAALTILRSRSAISTLGGARDAT